MSSNSNKELNRNEYWMFGVHACLAALSNPKRKIIRVLISQKNKEILKDIQITRSIVELVNNDDLNNLFPIGTAHQGIAIQTQILPNENFILFLEKYKTNKTINLLILDQVQDPRNIGGMIRSALAFNVDAIILTDSGTPEESGNIAKSAAGAIEFMPMIRVPNLARAIKKLKAEKFWITGLTQNGSKSLTKNSFPDRSALIIGSEGKGLRNLTEKLCDFLIKIEINSKVESLNNANAAAIALYEISQKNNLN